MSKKPSTVYPNGVEPKLGDIARSADVGRGTRALRVWEACPECGNARWIKKNTSGTLCKSCALRAHSSGESNRRWNPTRRTTTKSGIRVYIDEHHPLFCMAGKCGNGYVILDHRIVMAETLGRPLEKWEVVHHIDGDNQNNDSSNLQLLPNQTEHTAYTMLQTRVYRLEQTVGELQTRILLLEAENELLRSQVSLDRYGNLELAEGDYEPSGKCGGFTLPILEEHQDKEQAHPSRKLGDFGASREPTQAALTQWRCENLPKRGTLTSGSRKPEYGNPVARREDLSSQTSVETVQEAHHKGGEETVRP